jgi:hypothetical protein
MFMVKILCVGNACGKRRCVVDTVQSGLGFAGVRRLVAVGIWKGGLGCGCVRALQGGE